MELPVSKIKRIAKFDPDVKLVSNEGAVALTLSCEMFIKSLAQHVYEHTQMSKRRTVQIRDFDACVQNTPVFAFLEGALETWADVAGDPGASVRKKGPEDNAVSSTDATSPVNTGSCAEGENELLPAAIDLTIQRSPKESKRQRLDNGAEVRDREVASSN